MTTRSDWAATAEPVIPMGIDPAGLPLPARASCRHHRHHRFSYWLVAFAFLTVQAYATTPSPLYGIYAERDGFTSLVIALIYGAYALGVMGALVLAGHLSDHLGRRPLVLTAIAFDVVSVIVFVFWRDLPGLFVARILCGIAVGITASTATAYLSELHRAHRPPALIGRAQLLISGVTMGGLGVGALVAGLLAQYVADPLTIPYLVILASFGVCAAGIARSAETRPRAVPLPPYRPQRASTPPHARVEFISALVAVAIAMAVLGLFIGLAGTFLVVVLHHTSLALAGATVALVFAASVAIAPAMRTPRTAAICGVAITLIGLAALVVSAWLSSPSLVLFLVSGAVLGAGASALFRGSLGVAIGVSPPAQLAESLTTFYLSGYSGLAVPVVAIGVALQLASPRWVLLGFAAVIAAGVIAAAPFLTAYRAPTSPEAGPGD